MKYKKKIGNWKNGLKDGQGEYIWADGRIYKGFIISFINKYHQKLKGDWKDDQRNNDGIFIDKNGKKILQKWSKGTLIQ